jgi:hypothetical protein
LHLAVVQKVEFVDNEVECKAKEISRGSVELKPSACFTKVERPEYFSTQKPLLEDCFS